MKVSYFPGCTLKTKAKDLDIYAVKSAEKLGVCFEEVENWQCCGGVFTNTNDEIATKLSSIRLLMAARDKQQMLVTVCSACHNVVKQTNYAMQNDDTFNFRVNQYIKKDGEYNGETKVLHYLELLRDEIGFDTLKEKVTNPLTGKKIAAYYGCLLLRPGKVMAFDDAENPQIMENMIKALGADAVVYPQRNECCGGYISLEDKQSASKKSTKVWESAVNAGAEMIVTACPLCKYNLIKNGCPVPVVYFTELMAEALGVKEDISND